MEFCLKSAPVASLVIRSPLHKLLAWMKEETGFAVIVTSQIPVFIGWRKLVLFSPDTGITPPGAAESKGLQLFFTVYPRGTQACGVRQKSYLFLCHFIRPHRHTIRVRTQTHISKETFYLASIVSSEKCRKSLLRVVLFSQKLPNNITVPASFALLSTDYKHFHYTSIMQ